MHRSHTTHRPRKIFKNAGQSKGVRTPVQVCGLLHWVVDDFVTCLCRSKADLTKQLQELKAELLSLRVQKITSGNAAKLTKMCVLNIMLHYHVLTLYSFSSHHPETPSASRLHVSLPSWTKRRDKICVKCTNPRNMLLLTSEKCTHLILTTGPYILTPSSQKKLNYDLHDNTTIEL